MWQVYLLLHDLLQVAQTKGPCSHQLIHETRKACSGWTVRIDTQCNVVPFIIPKSLQPGYSLSKQHASLYQVWLIQSIWIRKCSESCLASKGVQCACMHTWVNELHTYMNKWPGLRFCWLRSSALPPALLLVAQRAVIEIMYSGRSGSNLIKCAI